MDIDALKAAMTSLDEAGGELALPGDAARRKAGRSVATLANAQIVQIVSGAAVAIAGGTVWEDLMTRPGLLFASGLIVNIYGVAMIAWGVAGLAHASRIDMAAPILETEGRMIRLRRIMLISGWLLGVSWCVLWLPLLAVAVRLLLGADMLAPVGIGAWLAATVLSGMAGWAGLWLLRGWSRRNGRAPLAARMDEILTGRSFQTVQRQIDQVTRFSAG